MSYDISAGTFGDKFEFTGSATFIFDFSVTSGIFYAVGSTSDSEAFLIRSSVTNIDILANITTSSDTMSQVTPGANYEITTLAITPNTPASYVPTIGTNPSDVSTTISVTFDNTSDIVYYNDEVNIGTVSALTTGSVSTDFTCSVSGSTAITYSITETDQSAGPSWMTADSANQQIDYTTPSHSSTTTYSLYLFSSWSSNNHTKNITITVSQGSGTSSSTASETVEDTKTAATVTTSTAMGVAAASTVTTSVATNSSPQGMWSMIHQFQLYLLLPLVTFIPQAFEEFLEGYSFVLFNFDFIELPSTPGYDGFIDYFDCETNDSYLENIGLESD